MATKLDPTKNTDATGLTSAPTGFRADIQGLRGIAVALVVLFHAGVRPLSGGYVGVDVFFVISGFLITSRLTAQLDRRGRIDFGAFYARRARRILPASFLVLVLSVVSAWIWMPPLQHRATLQDAIATALYVPNLLFAAQHNDYLAETVPSVFQQYWSLGVEEQFYLCWPALLVVVHLLLRRSRRGLATAVGVVAVTSFVLCIVVTDRSVPWAFFSLPTRAWELAIGALIAMLLTSAPGWLRRQVLGLLGYAGLALVLFAAIAFNSSTEFPGAAAVIPVAGAALVIVGGSASSSWAPGRLLGCRPLQFVGAISYSLYLIHWPLLVVPQAAAGWTNPLPLLATLALAAAAVPLAYLSFRFVEQPFQRSGFLNRARPRRTLLSAAAGSAVIVMLCVCGLAMSSLEPMNSGGQASAYRLATAPAGTAYVPSNLTPDLEHVAADNPEIYANGCHRYYWSAAEPGCRVGPTVDVPRVALFGDSHAAQWYPALAELARAGTIELQVETMSQCGSVPTRTDFAECTAWRQGVLQRLAADPPAVVLMGNYIRHTTDGDDEAGQHWDATLKQAISALPSTSRIAVIADTPFMVATPAICLSAHLTDAQECAMDRDRALDSTTRAAETRLSADGSVGYIDLTDYLCNAATCPAIIGNVLVYRDASHITQTFSAALAPVVGDALATLLQPET